MAFVTTLGTIMFQLRTDTRFTALGDQSEEIDFKGQVPRETQHCLVRKGTTDVSLKATRTDTGSPPAPYPHSNKLIRYLHCLVIARFKFVLFSPKTFSFVCLQFLKTFRRGKGREGNSTTNLKWKIKEHSRSEPHHKRQKDISGGKEWLRAPASLCLSQLQAPGQML